MKKIGISTAVLILTACTTQNEIISSSGDSITIRPRNDVPTEESRIKAASLTAQEYCQSLNKTAEYKDASKIHGRYSAVTFMCK